MVKMSGNMDENSKFVQKKTNLNMVKMSGNMGENSQFIQKKWIEIWSK